MGHVLAFCAVVQYEWLRRPRTQGEQEPVRRFFGDDAVVSFGNREAQAAAADFAGVPGLTLYQPGSRSSDRSGVAGGS